MGLDSDQKLLNKSIAYSTRLLANREYSRKSLEQKLRQKGFSKSIAVQTLEYLTSNNWQCDQRFSESFVRSRINKGQGETRIRYELSQHGVNQQMIEQAFSCNSVDWQELCEQVCERKSNILSHTDKLKSKLKLERFLKYRGFSSEQIYAAINKVEKKWE